MRKLYSRGLSLFCFCLLLFIKLYSQPPTISYQSVITGLSIPIDIVNAHDGSNRLFIAQQGGTIKVWNGTTLSTFINLSSIISTNGGERGLITMAFHPNFNGTTNRYFFVYYTNTNGDVEVSRFQTTAGNSNTADISTQTVIITIPHPTNTNHNGGKLNFGPDGYLYFATGDGGGGYDSPNNAQNGNVLLGKMLRIDIDNPGPASHPNYSIPADNPYVSDPSVLDEIWNLGLRNPYRWSFDRATGNMWIGDVGQDTQEEVDYRPAGSTGHNNFGWRCYEGYVHTPTIPVCSPDPPADYVKPVLHYDNPNGASSPSSAVTGGFVYRGNEYTNFRGYYVAADVYSGTMYFLWPNGSGGFDSSFQTGLQTFVVAFGEGEDGSLYAVSQGTNTVYKLVATGGTPLPVVLNSFTAKHYSAYNELKWTTASEQNTSKFLIEYSTDKTSFNKVGEVVAKRNASGSSYSFDHYLNQTGSVFYRLAMQDDNGLIKYSSILRIASDASDGVKIYPSVVTNNVINLVLPSAAQKFQLVNLRGQLVYEKILGGFSGTMSISLPSLNKGLYIAQIMEDNGISRTKIVVQ